MNIKCIFSNRRPIKWRIDEDGNLRVTICVLKEGVYYYDQAEIPVDFLQSNAELLGKQQIAEYIPLSEISSKTSLKSLEGKDIVIDAHEWRTPETFDDGLIVGSVAGTPYVVDGELLCDAIIKDKDAIERITSNRVDEKDRLIEVSAGYDGDIVVSAGDFKGKKYDAKQENLRFNHILLLPAGAGRCGADVRIVNKKQEKRNMVTFKVRIGNTERAYKFTNEEDAKEAEGMLDDERTFNGKEIEQSLTAKKDLEGQISELKQQLAEHDAKLQQAQQALEQAMSENTQEILAAEMQEQTEDEDEIANAEVSEMADDSEGGIANEEDAEKKKEEILNSWRLKEGKKNTLSVRRENCVRSVFERQKMTIPDTWDNKAFDAAFETLAVKAKIANAKQTAMQKRIVNGKMTQGTEKNSNNDARTRMLNAMKVRKGQANK